MYLTFRDGKLEEADDNYDRRIIAGERKKKKACKNEINPILIEEKVVSWYRRKIRDTFSKKE